MTLEESLSDLTERVAALETLLEEVIPRLARTAKPGDGTREWLHQLRQQETSPVDGESHYLAQLADAILERLDRAENG